MQHERSNFSKFQIHEKTLSTTQIICGSGEFTVRPKTDQSLFSLLLEIESRLRTEGRNDQNERRKRSKGKERDEPEPERFEAEPNVRGI
jgi:hypothetical protein